MASAAAVPTGRHEENTMLRKKKSQAAPGPPGPGPERHLGAPSNHGCPPGPSGVRSLHGRDYSIRVQTGEGGLADATIGA